MHKISKYLRNGHYSIEASDKVKENNFKEAITAYKAKKATPIQKGMVKWGDGVMSKRHNQRITKANKAADKMLEAIFKTKIN